VLTTDVGDLALMDLRSIEMDPAPAVEATAGDG
jgi:hypothetical protein